MFKTLKRNLKLGLTTLTILTAGGFAGTAFAQSYSNDRVGYCAKYPSSSLCPRQVDNCVNYPFGTSTYYYGSGGCARTFTAQELIVARVRYCGKSANRSKSVCRTTVARPNAANWAKQNPNVLTTPTAGVDQFLKGTADGVDTGSLSVWGSYEGSLNLNTATFNGRALGGDATDGVAFFIDTRGHFHTGIFSGTDLGAPVTQTSGRANWVGQFKAVWWDTNQDFVLEVTFGGDGNKAGSIEAFVDRKGGRFYSSYDYTKYFYLKGDFDNSGLITGTVDVGDFTNKDRNRPTGIRRPGVLTGLIGQEGAVGAFHSNGDWYAGGFVARPAWPVTSATWLRSFTQALPSAPSTTNRRHQFLKGTRSGLNKGDIELLISSYDGSLNMSTAEFNGQPLGGDAADGVAFFRGVPTGESTWYTYAGIFSGTDLGAPVTQTSGTANWVGRFQSIRSVANTEFVLEVNFNGTGNKAGFIKAFVKYGSGTSHFYLNGSYDAHGVITGTVDAGPFANNDRNSSTRTPNGTLTGLIGQEGAVGAFYGNRGYAGGFVARPAEARVNSATWLQSFTQELPSVPSTTNRRHQFLKGTASGVNKGDTLYSPWGQWQGFLNMRDATFNGTRLGGDVADGMAFFVAAPSLQSDRHGYAGIFSGTDLGAPVTNLSGTARWVGSFNSSHTASRDFVLEIDFDGGNQDGTIEAFVEYRGYTRYYLKGSFDDKGVIAGTVNYGNFSNGDRNNPTGTRYYGVLTGLIGADGAVGAFRSDSSATYSGGFVARPANNSEKAFLNRTCAADPSHKFCYSTSTVSTVSTAVIADCIIGNNANASRCSTAISRISCIKNPFASSCKTNSNFRNFYVQARANRITFCDNPRNANDNLCRTSTAKGQICNYDPFNAVCFGNNTFNTQRANKVIFCQSGTRWRDPTCKGAFLRPNTATLLNAVGGSTPTTPDIGSPRNQFLKGTPTGLDNGDVTVFSDEPITRLTLAHRMVSGASLGGDVADGVAFFGGLYDRKRLNFAGILAGTNLGAPLTPTNTTTYWNGRIKTHANAIDKDFRLKITFNSGRNHVGQVEAFVQNTSVNHYQIVADYFHIKGNFDSRGVITGTVDLGAFANDDRGRPIDDASYRRPGVLRGLIGKEGAVGAFISQNDLWNGYYSGGFVASPNVADPIRYARYAGGSSLGIGHYTRGNGFIAAPFLRKVWQSNGEVLHVNREVSYSFITPQIINLNLGTSFAGKYGTGDTRDGVFFFRGRTCRYLNGSYSLSNPAATCTPSSAASNNRHFVGINPNTHLGPVLDRTTGVAQWRGKIVSFIADNLFLDRDFSLRVDYRAQSVSASVPFVVNYYPYTYSINGRYDRNGVIRGTVTAGRISGTLSGLIGRDGAVGAFVATNSLEATSDFSGGFVAQPPR